MVDSERTGDAVSRDPSVQGGAPVFGGTRVPVIVLFDYLEAGQSVDAFLEQYPAVTREQALAAVADGELRAEMARARPAGVADRAGGK